MQTAKITSKGQITLPARMREKLRLMPGSRVVFEEQTNGDFVVRKLTGDIRDARNLLPRPGRAFTVEEMKEGVAAAVAERLDRSR